MHKGFEVAKFNGKSLPPVHEATSAAGVLRGNPVKTVAGVWTPLAGIADVPITGIALNDYGSSPGSQIGMASYVSVVTPADSPNRVSCVVPDLVTEFWGFIHGAAGDYVAPTAALIGSPFSFSLEIVDGVSFLIKVDAPGIYVTITGIDTQLNRVRFRFLAAAL